VLPQIHMGCVIFDTGKHGRVQLLRTDYVWAQMHKKNKHKEKIWKFNVKYCEKTHHHYNFALALSSLQNSLTIWTKYTRKTQEMKNFQTYFPRTIWSWYVKQRKKSESKWRDEISFTVSGACVYFPVATVELWWLSHPTMPVAVWSPYVCGVWLAATV
jgi:hypothetical protein